MIKKLSFLIIFILFSTALLVNPASANQTVYCNGYEATIIGTEQSETIYGTPEDDIIVALGGRDIIYGFSGNDIICGGQGKDRIFGGKDNDIIYGEGAGDKLFGGKGDDMLYGGGRKDRIRGGKGTDYLNGGKGNDDCVGETEESCNIIIEITLEQAFAEQEKLWETGYLENGGKNLSAFRNIILPCESGNEIDPHAAVSRTNDHGRSQINRPVWKLTFEATFNKPFDIYIYDPWYNGAMAALVEQEHFSGLNAWTCWRKR